MTPLAPPRPARWEWAALAVILFIAMTLRWRHIDARSFWVDEISTRLSIHGTGMLGRGQVPRDAIIPTPLLTQPATAEPVWKTLRPDPDDIHPPLYFFLARLWSAIFGWSDAALRSFSAASSVAAIALLYLVVRRLNGTASALWAAAVMAVAQPQIEMAQEARAYTLVLVWSLGAAIALMQIEHAGSTRLRIAALFLCTFALPFTHYFGCSAVFTLVIYAAIRLRGHNRRITMVTLLAAITLFGLLWGHALYLQSHGASRSGTTFFVEEPEGHLLRTLGRLMLLPVRFLFQPLPNSRAIAGVFAGVCVAPLFLLHRRPELLLWLLWIPINIAPTLFVDLTHPSWSLELLRYTFFATPAVYAIIGSLAATAKPPLLRYALPLATVLACVLHLDQAYVIDGQGRQNWRRFARDFDTIAQPGDIGLFATAQAPNDYPIEFLVCLRQYSNRFPSRIVVMTHAPDPVLLQQLRAAPGVIYVSDFLPASDRLAGWTVASPSVGLYELGHATRFTPPRNVMD